MADASRFGWLRWIVPLAGALLLVLLALELGADEIATLFASIGWNIVIVVVLFGCHECVRAAALSRCLMSECRPSFRRLLWTRFFGEAVRTLTHSGPFVSEPARAWMLSRHTGRGAHGYAASISELIANIGVSALVTVVVLSVILNTMPLSRPLVGLTRVLLWASAAYVLVAVTALAGRVYVIGAILRRVVRLPIIGRHLRTDPQEVRRMEDAILHVLRDRPIVLLQVVGFELVAQGLPVLEIYWTMRAMGQAVTFQTAAVVEALTKVANVVQIVGATEGSYALVFRWLGMTAAVGFTLSLVKRVRSLIAAVLGLGLLKLVDRWSVESGNDPLEPPPLKARRVPSGPSGASCP